MNILSCALLGFATGMGGSMTVLGGIDFATGSLITLTALGSFVSVLGSLFERPPTA